MLRNVDTCVCKVTFLYSLTCVSLFFSDCSLPSVLTQAFEELGLFLWLYNKSNQSNAGQLYLQLEHLSVSLITLSRGIHKLLEETTRPNAESVTACQQKTSKWVIIVIERFCPPNLFTSLAELLQSKVPPSCSSLVHPPVLVAFSPALCTQLVRAQARIWRGRPTGEPQG